MEGGEGGGIDLWSGQQGFERGRGS